MSDSKLNVLKQHQPALLLVEVIGWLHDYRKCSEEHLQTQTLGSKTQALPRTELVARQPSLQNISLVLQPIQGTSRTVTDLLNDQTWHQDTLGQFLSRCHNTAHFDKQEPVGGEQNYPGTQISSAFGFEKSVGATLTNRLWGLPWGKLSTLSSDWKGLREQISTLFAHTIADSRRPINEVDLWSWGSFVGALYKSALAGALLTGSTPSAKDLQWRLLSIRVDGLEYISNVARVPDLMARQQLLSDALDQVRALLEVEYPLGSEVYHDQNGSIFIVPDIPDLLRITDGQGTTLHAQIVQTFAKGTVQKQSYLQLGGEVLPVVTLEQDSWWGQDPNWSRNIPTVTNDKLPNIKDVLAKQVITQADAQVIEELWPGKEGKWEVCPVCRLRPMREGAETCEICLKRRGSRIAEWLADPHRTIWMDEIADYNGRVALLVGKFGLEDWLSGDLVQTMLVKADSTTYTFTPKNPSPARLRRVWETCQHFWTETVQRILNNLPGRERWLLKVQETDNLPPEGIVCDGTLNGFPISVWRMGDGLLTVSFLPQAPAKGHLNLDWEYNRRKHQVTYHVEDVHKPSADYLCYHPTLTLLTSPDKFLAFVPAYDSLGIADKIRQEYQKQFGKVQNRLPLFLGLVFFQRKTPLTAAIDTARRMLEQVGFEEEEWLVECNREVDGTHRHLRFFQGELRVHLEVPIKMGDGTTNDDWYPYFFFEGDPGTRSLCFQHNGCWLVHVNDLREGDRVKVTPSRFAYLYLEHTAQRFKFEPSRYVMLLEELPIINKIWQDLKGNGITDTGLRGVAALLEAKAEMWGRESREFQQLVETTLKEAGLLRKEEEPDAVSPEDVLNGRFSRCLELYLHILKHRAKEGNHESKEYSATV